MTNRTRSWSKGKRPCCNCIIRHLDARMLLIEIGLHSAALDAWLGKPPAEPHPLLVGRDVRLADFDPIGSWSEVVSVIARAEEAAAKTCKSIGRAH